MTRIRCCAWLVLALFTTFEIFAASEDNQSIAVPTPSAKETSVERRERIDIEVQEILNTALDDDDYGETMRCIWSHRYDKIELIDERRVIFYGARCTSSWGFLVTCYGCVVQRVDNTF